MKKMIIVLIASTMINGGNISSLESLNVEEKQEVVLETSTFRGDETEGEETFGDENDVDTVSESMFDENALVGYWVDSLTSETPEVIHIYMKDGMLWYRHYQILYRKSFGTISRDEYKTYEYTKGFVWYFPESETVSCARYNVPIFNFYYFSDIPDVMIEKESGTTFYRFEGILNAY